MTTILDQSVSESKKVERWDALVNRHDQEISSYWHTRERRLIALALLKGADVRDVAQVIDPFSPVTVKAVYLHHPMSSIQKVQSEIKPLLVTKEEAHE